MKLLLVLLFPFTLILGYLSAGLIGYFHRQREIYQKTHLLFNELGAVLKSPNNSKPPEYFQGALYAIEKIIHPDNFLFKKMILFTQFFKKKQKVTSLP